MTVVFCFLVSPVLINPPDFHKNITALEPGKKYDFSMESLQTMRSTFRTPLSSDFCFFRVLTVISCFAICVAFQPFQQVIFHHQLTPTDLQSRKIRAVQKVVCPSFGNLQCFCDLLGIHYIRHGFKGLSVHNNLLSGMKKQPRNNAELLCSKHNLSDKNI